MDSGDQKVDIWRGRALFCLPQGESSKSSCSFRQGCQGEPHGEGDLCLKIQRSSMGIRKGHSKKQEQPVQRP